MQSVAICSRETGLARRGGTMDANTWTALGTWVAVAATVYLVGAQVRSDKRVNQVQIQVRLDEHFWSPFLLGARKQLAEELLKDSPDRNSIQDLVPNYFDWVGILLRRRELDLELVWNSLGYYGPYWWFACKTYVDEERRHLGDRGTLFENFAWLADRLLAHETKRGGRARPGEVVPSPEQVRSFLKDEAALK